MQIMKLKHVTLNSLIMGVFLSMQSIPAIAAPSDAMVQELAQKLDALGREVNVLRGENEKLTHELEQIKSNQRKGFLAIDERFEKNQPAAPVKSTKPPVKKKPVAQSIPNTPKNTRPTNATKKPIVGSVTKKPVVKKPEAKPTNKHSTNSEKAEYNQAYQLLKGDRQKGINAFTVFLQKHPNSPLAENAHYWIGEAKYAKKDYKGAIDSFVVVLNKYKSGRKAPDAAVKLGYSFYALKDWVLAKRTFDDVLRYFPGSNAAKLAKARLDRMQKEGH